MLTVYKLYRCSISNNTLKTITVYCCVRTRHQSGSVHRWHAFSVSNSAAVSSPSLMIFLLLFSEILYFVISRKATEKFILRYHIYSSSLVRCKESILVSLCNNIFFLLRVAKMETKGQRGYESFLKSLSHFDIWKSMTGSPTTRLIYARSVPYCNCTCACVVRYACVCCFFFSLSPFFPQQWACPKQSLT